jgi:large subunit ribosomal protein L30
MLLASSGATSALRSPTMLLLGECCSRRVVIVLLSRMWTISPTPPQVPHLVNVETDRMFYLRQMRSYLEQLCRPPIVVQHGVTSGPADPAKLTAFAQKQLAEHVLPSKVCAGIRGVTSGPCLRSSHLLLTLTHPSPCKGSAWGITVDQPTLPGTALQVSGYAKLWKQQPPRKYDKEKAQQRRVRTLTERGLFSSSARRDHERLIQPPVPARSIAPARDQNSR